ncbi:type II toxin-antitoxin system Phd/YefM family antitoxin [Mycobacterium sp. IS-1556]|uniref:type II toxin-antitoxin system Phd/YefM family antitoxin n=1 Tax=Mycobacterium sp. IS-1556 TaxID=1772276 RepID=UPI0009E6FD2F|nr:type II toxin-antitoxin system Phd/YefM family antitoxin [Mycobacterium sp. IS-1556]
MSEVSIRVLNQETSKVLARVKRGEEITLTERGEVIARIIPASAGPLDALISSGRVQPATVHGPAPRPTIPMRDGLDAGTLLERLRSEERY